MKADKADDILESKRKDLDLAETRFAEAKMSIRNRADEEIKKTLDNFTEWKIKFEKEASSSKNDPSTTVAVIDKLSDLAKYGMRQAPGILNAIHDFVD